MPFVLPLTDQSRKRRHSDIVEPERPGTADRLRRQAGPRRFESGQDGAEQLLQERDTGVRLLRPEGNAHFGRCFRRKSKAKFNLQCLGVNTIVRLIRRRLAPSRNFDLSLRPWFRDLRRIGRSPPSCAERTETQRNPISFHLPSISRPY